MERRGGCITVVIPFRSLLIDYTCPTPSELIEPNVYLACTLYYIQSLCFCVFSSKHMRVRPVVNVMPNSQTQAGNRSLFEGLIRDDERQSCEYWINRVSEFLFVKSRTCLSLRCIPEPRDMQVCTHT